MNVISNEHALMARALRLAEKGLFTTQPNPRVGCVIVRDGEVVGEGWHQMAGQAHAEIIALQQAGERAKGATLFVTLEPCAHHGRTPPCTDALIQAGVSRVVSAVEDPNPSVGGHGHAQLREAGVAVDVGILQTQAQAINRGFFKRHTHGKPWLRLKLGMSLDARTALSDGQSQWITGEAARADVQNWRAQSSALLTGITTVLQDDPQLTVRLPESQIFIAPLRVVLDSNLRTPQSARIMDAQAPTIIFCASDSVQRNSKFRSEQIVACARSDQGVDLNQVLDQLAQRECNEVQVEAGATLSGAMLMTDLVDELLLYINPSVLGDAARPLLHIPQLQLLSERRQFVVQDLRMVGDDMRVLMRPKLRAA